MNEHLTLCSLPLGTETEIIDKDVGVGSQSGDSASHIPEREKLFVSQGNSAKLFKRNKFQKIQRNKFKKILDIGVVYHSL